MSVSSSGAQAKPGPDPFGGSAAMDMSADGRYVLFRSDASEPRLPATPTRKSDGFIHDRVTGKTRRIRPAGVGITAGALSANGRYAVLDAGRQRSSATTCGAAACYA